VSWGAGTRAGQFLVLGAKARASSKAARTSRGRHPRVGRAHAAPPHPLNYRAEAEGVRVERSSNASSRASSRRSNEAPNDSMAVVTPNRPSPPRPANVHRRAGPHGDPQPGTARRVVVEGFWSGLHRSPYHGFSVEFTEYRQYTPGDDPRYLDWRVFARSDRYYIKKFEDETNLRCHLLVDGKAAR
jgi:hypothetical protein